MKFRSDEIAAEYNYVQQKITYNQNRLESMIAKRKNLEKEIANLQAKIQKQQNYLSQEKFSTS